MSTDKITRTSNEPSKSSNVPPFVFVRITAVTGKDLKPGIIILEHHAHTRKEYSSPAQMASNGFFVNPIECALKTDQKHWFNVQWIPPRHPRPSLRGLSRTAPAERLSLLSFELDPNTLLESILKAGESIVTEKIGSSTGVSVIFQGYLNESFSLDTEDLSEVVSVDVLDLENSADSSQTAGVSDMSFSSVSEDCETVSTSNASELDPIRRSVRVRFDKEIHRIPTTEQLEKDIQQALMERATLSQAVGDLSSQFFQMKHDIRDVKECLRQLSELTPTLGHDTPQMTRQKLMERNKMKRRVVIDGDMVAEAYISGTYSVEAIDLALSYYKNLDVSAIAIVSQGRVKDILPSGTDKASSTAGVRLQRLVNTQRVSVTSSHSKRGDFLIQYALDQDADIVTNDDFQRSLKSTNRGEDWRKLVSFFEARRIPFMFIGDKFVPGSRSDSSSSTPRERKSVLRSDTL